jgi:hypothetical protein
MKKAPAEFAPAVFKKADVVAIQAVMNGAADKIQQQRALNFIIFEVCKTYDLAYRPGDTNATHFALGRQFAGQQIVHLMKLPANKIEE